MEKVKQILKIALFVIFLPILLILTVIGFKTKYLDILLNRNHQKDDELKNEQAMVEKAIKDLDDGLKKIKHTPEDDPSEVEKYHENYYKNNK